MNQRKDKICFRLEDQSGVIQADLLFLEFSTVGWVSQQQNKKQLKSVPQADMAPSINWPEING